MEQHVRCNERSSQRRAESRYAPGRYLEESSLDRPLERVLALVTEGVDHVVAQAAMTRPVLLAGEQGGGHERRPTPRFA